MDNPNIDQLLRDVFDERHQDFTDQALVKGAIEEFKPRPYYQKFRGLYLTSQISSFAFNIISAITAASLVYLISLKLTGYVAAAVILSVLILGMLEASKRAVSTPLFSRWVQFRKLSGGLLGVMVLLTAISVSSSYFGADMLVHEYAPPAPTITADTIQEVRDLKAQIAAKEAQLQEYRSSPSYRNSQGQIMWNVVHKTIPEVESSLADMRRRLTEVRAGVDQKNTGIEGEHKTEVTVNGAQVSILTLVCEFFFLLAIYYQRYYRWRIVTETLGAVKKAAKEPHQEEPSQQAASSYNGNGNGHLGKT